MSLQIVVFFFCLFFVEMSQLTQLLNVTFGKWWRHFSLIEKQINENLNFHIRIGFPNYMRTEAYMTRQSQCVYFYFIIHGSVDVADCVLLKVDWEQAMYWLMANDPKKTKHKVQKGKLNSINYWKPKLGTTETKNNKNTYIYTAHTCTWVYVYIKTHLQIAEHNPYTLCTPQHSHSYLRTIWYFVF